MIKRKLFWILVCLPVVAVAVLSYDYFAFSGTAVREFGFEKRSGFISNLFPLNRTGEIKMVDGDYFQEIIADPVYFRVLLPVRFNDVIAKIKFLAINQNVVELGVARNADASAVQLKPLFNKLIESMTADQKWNKIEESGQVLFQRQSRFKSIGEFRNKARFLNPKTVALYNAALPIDYILSNYQAMRYQSIFDYPISGRHQLYAYIKNEKLNFTFKFNAKADGTIKVASASGEIYSRNIDSEIMRLEISDLPEGVYKIFVNVGDDAVINSISTVQNKWSFVHELKLASQNGQYQRKLNLYTEANNLYFQTKDESGVQALKINDHDFNIEQRNKQYKYKNDGYAPLNLEISKSGLKINSTGAISLSSGSYINPEYVDFRSFQETKDVFVDYVLAEYSPPVLKDGWLEKEVNFDLKNAFYDNKNRAQFVISLPGIGERQGRVEISYIQLKLNRAPLSLEILRHKFFQLIAHCY